MIRRGALLLAVVLLSGCATTRDVRVRALPDERPAASRAAEVVPDRAPDTWIATTGDPCPASAP